MLITPGRDIMSTETVCSYPQATTTFNNNNTLVIQTSYLTQGLQTLRRESCLEQSVTSALVIFNLK